MADIRKSEADIDSVLRESRVFPAPQDFARRRSGAHIESMPDYQALYERSLADPDGFWGEMAGELHWFKPWSQVLEWKLPDAKWFVGGKTNLCYNCVDRHDPDAAAIVWEGEPGDIRRLSYGEVKRQTAKLANVMRELGVKKGDVVTIYMGMTPELAIALLACARMGAVHSVIFGGFSAQAIADRVRDADSRVILTADGAWRRGKIVPLKQNVDDAIATLGPGQVDKVRVLNRCGNDIAMESGRDYWWSDVVDGASDDFACVEMDSEDMLFLLYTSGSTGKPKGIVHTTGGYMVYTYLTSKFVFDLEPGLDEPARKAGPDGHLFWCTADIGWVTGHSYIVYGIMSNGIPTFMYEGAPNHPGPDRFWDIVERHQVTQFYTAPTAIRAFMKWGDEHPAAHDLSSLEVIGTVGEPINPEAWMWYHRSIGRERCPIVDTWWQTETGGHMITPLPGATPTKPGSCTLPFFGIDAAIVNERGREVPNGTGGLLAIRKPWPGMLRGIHGDRQRFIDTYWSRIKGCYFPGDGAKRDDDGYFWIMGRVDDVINVSGHRLGTMEVESALVSHESVVEAAVVGMPHEIKGTGITAFCTLEPRHQPADGKAAAALKETLREHVAKEIGAIAKPDQIRFTDALPKTRSGKIMRRLLRDVAAGVENPKQDTTTLEDFAVLAKLREEE